ncbi:MAG TPA: type II toxin-antitoxin system HicB family antitoxin [Nevskiaceae bacterium]|nr:type II toxin-antitoxin system HicB family antitoxin [Nevskiaceae bacterium]
MPRPRVVQPVGHYSGRFVVRVPKSVHARLAREAAEQGVSLNQWAASKLA